MDDNQDNTVTGSAASTIKGDLTEVYMKVRKAAESALGYVMLRMDDRLCAELDALVEAGVAKSRSQAALYFLQVGLKANEGLFERILETEAEVEQLRQKMRSLRPLESTE